MFFAGNAIRVGRDMYTVESSSFDLPVFLPLSLSLFVLDDPLALFNRFNKEVIQLKIESTRSVLDDGIDQR